MEKLKDRLPELRNAPVWEKTEDLTMGQYKFLLALYYNNDPLLREKITEILGI